MLPLMRHMFLAIDEMDKFGYFSSENWYIDRHIDSEKVSIK